MKVYIVYSCYSDSYQEPSIFFEVCATEEKAQEIFNGYVSNIKLQSRESFTYRYEESTFEEKYDIEEKERVFKCKEIDEDQSWEAYIIEQELLA